MVDHIRVLAILLPGPPFRDVVLVFKVQHHLVLMTNRDAGEIAGAQESEGQLLYVTRGWHRAHMWLIVGGAIVLYGDSFELRLQNQDNGVEVSVSVPFREA
jgi:hypothetical protein